MKHIIIPKNLDGASARIAKRTVVMMIRRIQSLILAGGVMISLGGLMLPIAAITNYSTGACIAAAVFVAGGVVLANTVAMLQDLQELSNTLDKFLDLQRYAEQEDLRRRE